MIKNIILLTTCVFLCCILPTSGQAVKTHYPVIPQPVKIDSSEGYFKLDRKISLVAESETFLPISLLLADYLEKELNLTVKQLSTKKKKGRDIRFILNKSIVNPEEYHLIVKRRTIQIEAASPAAAYYAVQTLEQIITNAARPAVPCCSIMDYPRYAYRGFHVDLSRHFFTKEYLLKIIDWLGYYKINKLQLHLTDDQGWRIQLDKFPLLTSIGAWRTFNNLDSACMKLAPANPEFITDPRFIKEKDGKTVYGGYLTKQDIRDILRYAAAHYIEVIPEIDMPGHMSAAIRAYPYLSCTSSTGWGKEFSYPACPCKPEFMQFAFDVWDEIAGLFPSRYVHIGCDEVERDTWDSSAVCRSFMLQQGMQSSREIQNYFVNVLAKHLAEKGKTVIAWDDVIEGKIDSNLVMMYWRSWIKDSPLRCADNGNPIILTPASPFYISSDPTDEKLKMLYDYDPATLYNQVILQKVIGVQSCLWTEMIPSQQRFETQVFPSLQALSETSWTTVKNWESFKNRLLPHLDLMNKEKIHYRKTGIYQ